MRQIFEHNDQTFLYDLDIPPTVAYRRAHVIDETSLSVESSNENDSISPRTSTDDLNPATETAPITTGPLESSPEDPLGRSTESD